MSEVESRLIATTVHGQVLSSGPTAAEWLLIGLHGYGMTAASMYTSLLEISLPQEPRRVAVQALHAFMGKVEPGYSWMTRDLREQRISENRAYLEQVLQLERSHGKRLAWCGFSQGASMAYRAAAWFGGDALVINGGDIPPELSKTALAALPTTIIGAGDTDQFMTPSRLDADGEKLTAAGVNLTRTRFDGGHAWTRAWSAQVSDWLQSL